ncbi:Zn-ribbon domain-containing OB-fold protein [Cumulibacter manganitolerans]|uniref:Zn-ribbon domain-containing OB-fold protein n=1 Tax=Cumulibacter manganitolerans TaxID=1884992 RepID=UPI0012968445|nr:OB-fold domain-containing protein [Cumulibacter manganitolerans]
MSAKDMLPIDRDDASAAWFDAAADGRLLIRKCPAGHVSAPHTTTCPRCGSTTLQWIEAAGTGVLASYAVINRRDADPLPVAIVELDEGPWMRMQLQDVDPASLATNDPVEVRFAAPEGGEPIPYAVPRAAG